jgi:16S rRNA (uracil1498-N3)-methyltransferase
LTRRRWIADEVSENHAALTGDHAKHLTRVLRARVGQEFDIVANGIARHGRITQLSEDRVEFELAEEILTPLLQRLTLLLAIFKFDRMEWAVEKCTELGATGIVPLIARRTDSHLVSAAGKRVERWRRLAVQAAEQSRRAAAPDIAEPMKLGDALTMPGSIRIVLSEIENQTSLRDVLTRTGVGDTLLAFGPEGGWTEDELQSFHENGWLSVTLGQTILRAETAAIAATAIAVSEFNSHLPQPARHEKMNP